jgi:type IV pilus assembly protein PilC
MVQLVIIGEETGNLDLAFKNIATIYEEQLTNIIDNLNQLLEPVIIIILSIIVSSLIIGMYLPIFRLGTIL